MIEEFIVLFLMAQDVYFGLEHSFSVYIYIYIYIYQKSDIAV